MNEKKKVSNRENLISTLFEGYKSKLIEETAEKIFPSALTNLNYKTCLGHRKNK